MTGKQKPTGWNMFGFNEGHEDEGRYFESQDFEVDFDLPHGSASVEIIPTETGFDVLVTGPQVFNLQDSGGTRILSCTFLT